MAVDLMACRRQLMEALGDNSETYWNVLKMWYKHKIGKDELDTQARQCLGSGNIHFHNNFLLAILAKCQALGQTPAAYPRTPQKAPQKPQLIKKSKIKKQNKKPIKTNFEQRFEPSDPFKDAPLMSMKDINEECEIGLCSYDLMLPDTATIHGRLYLGAWDAGLDNVTDDTVTLLQHATEYLIKDILTVCCTRRSPYRLRGHFRHAVGSAYPRMHLRNTVTNWPPDERVTDRGTPGTSTNSNGRTQEQASAEAAMLVASADIQQVKRSPISPYDLRDSLQIHRRVLPSHTVYASNIERILSKLWHPSQEEIEQSQLHRLEAKRRFERLKQQRNLRL